MALSERAQKAVDELRKLGVPVHELEEEEGHLTARVFLFDIRRADPAKFDDEWEYFAGEHVRERFENGRYINPLGIRQDVHEILAKYELWTEWDNSSQVAVSEGPDATGYPHKYAGYPREHD